VRLSLALGRRALGAERSARQSEAAALLHVVPTSPGPERFRVLVADDDEDDRLLVRRQLEASGHFRRGGRGSQR
jgi:PleD family two-component response regulator